MSKKVFIGLEKLLEMMENNENFKLIETLGEANYNEWHIPGAHNIPTPKDMTVEQMREAAENLGLKKDDVVIVYCASYSCHASIRANKLLDELGYNNVLDFKGGKAIWKAAQLERE